MSEASDNTISSRKKSATGAGRATKARNMFGDIVNSTRSIITKNAEDDDEKTQLLEIKHALEQERAERAEMESRWMKERLNTESRFKELEKLFVSQHSNQSISQTSGVEGIDRQPKHFLTRTSTVQEIESFTDDFQSEVSLSCTMKQETEENCRDDNFSSTNSNDETKQQVKMKFTQDIFSLMMISPICSWGYFLGIATFCFQVILASDYILAFIRFFENEKSEYGFDIPVNVSKSVRFGQYCVALLSVWLQSDILISIQYFLVFRRGTKSIEILKQNQIFSQNRSNNRNRVYSRGMDEYSELLIRAVYLPNLLRLLQGAVVIILLMILIIMNDDFINLLMNFSALFIISQIDDIVFQLVRRGYFFGFQMAEDAEKIENIDFTEERSDSHSRCTSYFVRSFLLGGLNIFMIVYVSIIAKLQTNGYFLKSTYPNCDVFDPSLIGNKICDNRMSYNTEKCGWDGGDCIEFNAKYPNCAVENDLFIQNGECDGGSYNTEECGWDGGDCIEFNGKYPNCTVYYPQKVGDGWCHVGGYWGSKGYNTEECGWDGGDCDADNKILLEKFPKCYAGFVNPSSIGNGFCMRDYNSEECGWDGGDCIDFNLNYPNCTVERPYFIGDGQCNDGEYNSEECDWDGGDCLIPEYPNCHVDNPSSIGNGHCFGEYNTKECGWDGGDCDAGNKVLWEKYPNCTIGVDPGKFDFHPLGNNTFCTGGIYNTEECGWEGGDCDNENKILWEKYPDCKNGVKPQLVGDGRCDIGAENTEECGWDGGDCIDFNTKYPNCHVDNPPQIGNGFCTNEYNTEECGWDGGDCIEFSMKSIQIVQLIFLI